MEILLTGDPCRAQRAYELGLVNQVVPDAELPSATQALAERIAANAPLSVLAAKRTVYLTAEHAAERGLRRGGPDLGPGVPQRRRPGGPGRVPRQAAPGLDRPLMPPTPGHWCPPGPAADPPTQAAARRPGRRVGRRSAPCWTRWPRRTGTGPPPRSAGPSPTRSATWPTSTTSTLQSITDPDQFRPRRRGAGRRRRRLPGPGGRRAPAPGRGRAADLVPCRPARGCWTVTPAATRPPGCRGTARTWAWPPRSRPGSWRPGRTARTSPTPSELSGRRPPGCGTWPTSASGPCPTATWSTACPCPTEPIRVELTAPDGQTWTWGPAHAADRVTGPALDFCLAVTQRRHRSDTSLVVTGPVASQWMAIAQAFAGAGPGQGPATRRTAARRDPADAARSHGRAPVTDRRTRPASTATAAPPRARWSKAARSTSSPATTWPS